jgi:hypothetical protein
LALVCKLNSAPTWAQVLSNNSERGSLNQAVIHCANVTYSCWLFAEFALCRLRCCITTSMSRVRPWSIWAVVERRGYVAIPLPSGWRSYTRRLKVE